MGKLILLLLVITLCIAALVWFCNYLVDKSDKPVKSNSKLETANADNIVTLSIRIRKLENQYKEVDAWLNNANKLLNKLEKELEHKQNLHKSKSKSVE